MNETPQPVGTEANPNIFEHNGKVCAGVNIKGCDIMFKADTREAAVEGLHAMIARKRAEGWGG